MTERIYSRADIEALAERLYGEVGGKKRLLERIRNFKVVPALPGAIHNYYYVHKDVFDYGDLNALLGRGMCFLAGNREAGRDYVELLCALADTGYLIDYCFCDRAFDGYALALLVHSWITAKEDPAFAAVCGGRDQKTVEDWFYARACLMWRDHDDPAWKTYRPYDNQEIGIGACTVLAELFKDRDPVLAENFHALSDSRLAGWEKKNGNVDDTLFYTPVFCVSLWLYARYRDREDLLSLENCRATFENMLQQQPGNGIFTLYNWTQCGSIPGMMALGAHIFHDGRYKWMACRFLEERLERRNIRQQYACRNITRESPAAECDPENVKELEEVISEELGRQSRYDHVWEGLTDTVFHLWYFWDDSLIPERPRNYGQVLEKTAGQGRWPYDHEPVLPDKIVFRDGWNRSDMFMILNLWGGQNSPQDRTVSHRYPASNEIISLVRGEQFLVQNTDQVTRDAAIHRKDLNAFSLKRDGTWLDAPRSGERKFGVYPALELYNAELRFFSSFPPAEASKSTLYDYYGWTNERTVLLRRGAYAAVFDMCFGPTEETGAVRWHIQGRPVWKNPGALELTLLDSALTVLFPRREHWFSIEECPNSRPVAVYQHHADLDLDLVSRGRRMGFNAVFCHEAAMSACPVDVRCSGHTAFPSAMGLRLGEDLVGTRLGQYRDDYDYDGVKTDADAFIYNHTRGELIFFGARLFRFKPPHYRGIQAGGTLENPVTIQHQGEQILIRFETPQSGVIKLLL
ncbi:MAG: hypothetical protein LBR93_01975 [Treponema sp.]|nr:hypothetical protein [Treponema sp.]